MTHGNFAHIDLSKLPAELRTLAESWHQTARVAVRLDDAGEYLIMKLRPGENPWIGWSLVYFYG